MKYSFVGRIKVCPGEPFSRIWMEPDRRPPLVNVSGAQRDLDGRRYVRTAGIPGWVSFYYTTIEGFGLQVVVELWKSRVVKRVEKGGYDSPGGFENSAAVIHKRSRDLGGRPVGGRSSVRRVSGAGAAPEHQN